MTEGCPAWEGRGQMNITEVRVRRVASSGKLKAFASITIDNVFVVHDLKIIEGQKGLFVAMPSRKTGNGEFKDIAHPIATEARAMIQGKVVDMYNSILESEGLEPQQVAPIGAAAARGEGPPTMRSTEGADSEKTETSDEDGTEGGPPTSEQ